MKTITATVFYFARIRERVKTFLTVYRWKPRPRQTANFLVLSLPKRPPPPFQRDNSNKHRRTIIIVITLPGRRRRSSFYIRNNNRQAKQIPLGNDLRM